MCEQSLYFFDCCESRTLKKRKTPKKGVGSGVAPLRAKCKFQERRGKTKRSKRLHRVDLLEEQRRNVEMWNLILNKKKKKRSSHFTSCLLCEFLQRRFYLAKHTNKKFILSRTVLRVIASLWKGSPGTHTLRPHGSSSWRCFHSGGSITFIFRYLQQMFNRAAFYYQHYFVQYFWWL